VGLFAYWSPQLVKRFKPMEKVPELRHRPQLGPAVVREVAQFLGTCLRAVGTLPGS
jgi:hypothetical protein